MVFACLLHGFSWLLDGFWMILDDFLDDCSWFLHGPSHVLLSENPLENLQGPPTSRSRFCVLLGPLGRTTGTGAGTGASGQPMMENYGRVWDGMTLDAYI